MEIKEQLIVLRKIFYKCFVVGLFFLILAAVIYYPCKCYVASIYQSAFGVDVITYQNLWVIFVGLIKTILIFLFLVPALAIHWVTNCYEKEEKDSSE
ncbi:MAG TPA: hypothetical protein PKI94_04585 [Candidatus Gastranaerophilaceae bacterium]|nr:hypothetical protein [Candidatus Gastranaerophilaceae bacterium]